MKIPKLIIVAIICSLLGSCAAKKYTNIAYLEIPTKPGIENPTLNIFKPRGKTETKKPVVIFVHGGYWTAGDKGIYGFLGRNFAKKDLVTVIAGYTLSPNANYVAMATQIANAVKWTAQNISDYGGDPEQIFLMGHSAGGHLITLVSTNDKYLKDTSIIKGIILNDAAGLDMKTYLENNPPDGEHNYDITWTKDPKNWLDASPIYFLDENTPPFLIYLGTRTYPSITRQNNSFLEVLKPLQPNVERIELNKKHVPMMTQFFWPWNDRYGEILNFIEEH